MLCLPQRYTVQDERKMTQDTATVRLADTPRRLKAEFGVEAQYQFLYMAIVHGAIPAERINNRWHIPQSSLPKVAEYCRARLRHRWGPPGHPPVAA